MRPNLVVVLLASALAAGCGKAELNPDAAPPGDAAGDGDGDGDGGGGGNAALVIQPGTAMFGDALIGSATLPIQFQLSNVGDAASGLVEMTPEGNSDDFNLNAGDCLGAQLAPGETCDIEIGFGPLAAGERTASFRWSASPGGVTIAQVAGTALEPGDLVVTPGAFDFGTRALGTTSTTTTLTVVNGGDVATGALSVSLANQTDYELVQNNCGAPLAASDSCTIIVRHRPAAVGSTSTSVTISADPGGNAIANLGGTATARVTVNRTGTGMSRITSSPAGIDCDGSPNQVCQFDFAVTPVALTTQWTAADVFLGWSGDCSGTMAGCNLQLTAERTASARAEGPRTLTVGISGNGTVSGSGLTCTSTGCTGSYTYGQSVTITASPAQNQLFSGWGGDCSSNGQTTTCTLTMNANRTAAAAFGTQTFPVSVGPAGNGAGTITANAGGINCGTACSGSVAVGTVVTFTGSPATGSTVASWTGCTPGANNTCTLTVDGIENVTTTFTLQQFTLTVNGVALVNPPNQQCNGACTYTHNYGTAVSANFNGGDTCNFFSHWTGCDSVSGDVCNVTVTANKTITAVTENDPCCGDPCCNDPCCGDPCCGDPCCNEPCCGEICCIKPWMCDP